MEHINQLLNELENLTISMNIPIGRRKDYNWILRNVQFEKSR